MTSAPTSYDEVPYGSGPCSLSHPERLATVATLFGLSPPPIERARVLELGCAEGGNLIPLALTLPGATFVGIELSAKQAAEGQALIRALALPNIELRHASILDVGPSLGTFDYIIAHGVYSWAPRNVQDKILEIYAANLGANGVAFLSYNTYPGWHGWGMIREMMLFHSNRFAEPTRKLAQARALLDLLCDWAPPENDLNTSLLKKAAERIRTESDAYLYHEYLDEINDPIYFHQLVERADAKGLQFLGEADLSALASDAFQPDFQQKLREVAPDAFLLEQYKDFLRHRTFRNTLLVHKEAPIHRDLTAANLLAVHLASSVRPVASPVDLRSNQPVEFRKPQEPGVTTSAPLLKAALLVLAETWPLTISFADLYARAWQRLDQPPRRSLAEAMAAQQPGADDLKKLVFQMVNRHLMEIHLSPPRFVLYPGPRPMASPLARQQALQGKPIVTTLKHKMLKIGDFDQRLLPLLDGSRDREALIDELCRLAPPGKLTAPDNDQVATDAGKQRTMVTAMLDRGLTIFARYALLVA